MGLNEYQRGHPTPKTLFNALRLSPSRGVIAHVSPCFWRVAALGNSRISGQLLSRRPRWPSLATKSEPKRRNSCRRERFAPFPTRFAVSRSWKKLVFPGQRSRDRPRLAQFWRQKASRHAKILAAATPSPRFQHVSPCCGVGKNSYFRPILPKIAHVGATFCPETQNRPAIRKPPSGIFARRRTISPQKFPAVAVSPPPVLPARHACKYSSSA